MHRSGTSLVMSLLHQAGLDVGRDVTGVGRGNPRGHFEDRDFYRLHEEMLAAAGESCFSVGDGFEPPKSAGFEQRARTLIAQRAALPLWGWKDPRTCLFLDFWQALLPEARYLFVYRHPVDVVLSLWRRNNDPELQQDPWLAIHAWEVYNRRLLAFRERHPGRTFLAQVPGLTADFDGLLRRLRDELAVPLHAASGDALFVPEELAPLTPESLEWERVIPGALALYRQLEESADLPAREAGTQRQPARERDMLQTSESLLCTLLENNHHLGLLNAELEEERSRTAALEADLHHARRMLVEIEGSLSFLPVRAWWRLRRWLDGRRPVASATSSSANSATERSSPPSRATDPA